MESILESPFYPITPSTEDSNSPTDVENSQDEQTIELKFKANSSLPTFQLGPTPAQIGFRRKGQKLFSSSACNNASSATTTTTTITLSEAQIANGSNEIESAFKDRFSALPKVDFNQYKSPTQWSLRTGSFSAPLTYEPYKRRLEEKTINCKQNQQFQPKRLVGNRFFGPDFNAANLNGKHCFDFVYS